MRERAKRAVRQLAFLSGYSARRARARRCVRFLMFHDVGSLDYPLTLFEGQLQYLAAHFSVCALSDAISRLREDKIRGDEVVLTFDDGLESHATRVYPVLRRLGVPAAFFVCPGLIGSEEGIWTLETRARLSMIPRARADDWLRSAGAPAEVTVDQAVDWMKGLPVDLCRKLVADLRDVVLSETDAEGQRPTHRLMSWDQIRHLDSELITLGSHSVTHSMLPALEASELEREVGESRRLLEMQLGRACDFFCYPDGAHDSRVVDVTRRHYLAALTATDGLAYPDDDPHALPRIAAARSLPRLAWQLGGATTRWIQDALKGSFAERQAVHKSPKVVSGLVARDPAGRRDGKY